MDPSDRYESCAVIDAGTPSGNRDDAGIPLNFSTEPRALIRKALHNGRFRFFGQPKYLAARVG
ncbi:hypothetical protein F4561_003878 [Lipingzhangella halophila]|uniref:Uncharacterized protein n=1 Tax=Lipingzhangella halophila TaxID=1783352 RepID=A0A7W7W3Z4_9ACTN|nr:hypothetical protein [Lipingzhangella halophila]